MKVKHTYASRRSNNWAALSLKDSTTSLGFTAPTTRKRPLTDVLTLSNGVTALKRRKTSKSSTSTPCQTKQKALTQLHLSFDQPILRTCPLCDLSYTRGAPEDETLHRGHCARVQRGMEWGKEEERECMKAGVIQVASQVKLKNGKKGRILSCPADCTGRIGSKMTTLLNTINLSLSSPPLTQDCLRNSKVYLFLLPQTSATSSREKIVGCVIAQRISNAMAIASPEETNSSDSSTEHLVTVDSGTGLFCHPEPLPTPMGVPRLFVSSAHRRQGIASALLDAAAKTLIHGCPLSPREGQVAFTQPTGDGKALMTKWGAGNVRIYEE